MSTERHDTLDGTSCFPQKEWREASPESQGIDNERLGRALQFLESRCGTDGISECVVVRYGFLIWKGERAQIRHNVWSCTKSIVSTLLGVMIDSGNCTTESLACTFDDNLAEHYPGARLRHFVTMCSGYDAMKNTVSHNHSLTPFAPRRPMYSPGSYFFYSDNAMNELGCVLSRMCGMSLANLFRTKIAEPIGMTNWEWGTFCTRDGIDINGAAGNLERGIRISALDLARLGLLFLSHGTWNGSHIVSEGWLREAVSNPISSRVPPFVPHCNGPGVYGYNWWVNGIRPDGTRLWPSVPASTFAAAGFKNNKCFIIPSWNMVVVRLGIDGDIPGLGGLAEDRQVYDSFLALIGEALLDRDQDIL